MAEAYSPPGGPVVVDKMEESLAQEQGGQIQLTKAQLVPESRRPRRGVPEPTWKELGDRILGVYGNVT